MKKLLSILLFGVICFASKANEASCTVKDCGDCKVVSSGEKGIKSPKFIEAKAYKDLPENEFYWLEEPKSFEEGRKTVFIKGRFDAPEVINDANIIVLARTYPTHHSEQVN